MATEKKMVLFFKKKKKVVVIHDPVGFSVALIQEMPPAGQS